MRRERRLDDWRHALEVTVMLTLGVQPLSKVLDTRSSRGSLLHWSDVAACLDDARATADVLAWTLTPAYLQPGEGTACPPARHRTRPTGLG